MSSEPLGEVRRPAGWFYRMCRQTQKRRLLLLTRMYPLEVDVFLQLPSQVDLGAVLAHSPVVHQQEMGMKTVENI